MKLNHFFREYFPSKYELSQITVWYCVTSFSTKFWSSVLTVLLLEGDKMHYSQLLLHVLFNKYLGICNFSSLRVVISYVCWTKKNFPKPSLLMNCLIKPSTTVISYFILWWREVKWTGAWPKLTVANSMGYRNYHYH